MEPHIFFRKTWILKAIKIVRKVFQILNQKNASRFLTTTSRICVTSRMQKILRFRLGQHVFPNTPQHNISFQARLISSRSVGMATRLFQKKLRSVHGFVFDLDRWQGNSEGLEANIFW